MAVERQSIHSMGSLLSKGMSETNFWHHVSKLKIADLESLNQLLLTSPVLKFLPRDRPYRFAIDETNDPYYGHTCSENDGYVLNDKAKKSTTTFYRYITLELLMPYLKVTLSVLPVHEGVKKETYVQTMLDVLEDMGFSVEVLLLDRGFYSGEVFKLLMGREIPHIMPVKVQSEKMKAFLKGRGSGFTKYTLNEQKDPLELNIARRTYYLKGKYDKHGMENYGYVVHGLDWSPQKISRIYRKRFGIESSYSMRNKVRPRTTTRSPTVRYYLFLVSMLLRNVWMTLRWKYFRRRRRGPSTVDEDAFRFDTFRLIIWECARRVLKMIFEVAVLRPG